MKLKEVYKYIDKDEYLAIGEKAKDSKEDKVKIKVSGFPYRDKVIEEYVNSNGEREIELIKPYIHYIFYYEAHKKPAIMLILKGEEE